jgi:hypothetical protein
MSETVGRREPMRLDVLTVVIFAALIVALVALRQPPAPGVCVVGDAGARLAARIPPELARTYVDSARFRLGFGGGAIGSWAGLGEALAVDGTVYVRSTEYGTPQYFRLLKARRFQTTAFAYVPRGTTPRETVPLRRAASFGDTWRELGVRYPGGALIAGFVQFRSLHTIAISRPATEGLSLLQHPAHYYTEPMQTADNAWAYVVGMVAPGPPLPTRVDERLFQHLIARDRDGQLDTYGLALRLAEPPRGNSRVADLQPVSLGRVTADSIIEQGEVSAYPADRLAACRDAIENQRHITE